MWEPRPLATVGASTACNWDIFIFTFFWNIFSLYATLRVKWQHTYINDLYAELNEINEMYCSEELRFEAPCWIGPEYLVE
jgi:hypothetical protein